MSGTRWVVGMVAVAVVCLAPIVASAAGEATPRFRAVRGNGQITISVEAEGMAVKERISSQAFDLTISQKGDTVRFTGVVDGHVTVERGGRTNGFSMRDPLSRDFALVGQIVAASPALRQFGAVAASVRGRNDAGARVLTMAHEMVGLIQGNGQAVRETIGRATPPAGVGFTTVAQRTRDDGGAYGPSSCWVPYQRDVVRYTYELEGCMREARDSRNPLATAWCAYEYDLKATLAFYWLLDCNGYPW